MSQLNIFTVPPSTGHILARDGMERAARHADQVHDDWSAKAYDFLCTVIAARKAGSTFMSEDIRMLAEATGQLPIPPSRRAWGAIMAKAARSGLVIRAGFGQVKNERAHSATATVWQII